MQNTGRKTRCGFHAMERAVICVISVAIAAVIFWEGNPNHQNKQQSVSTQQPTLAQQMRMAGDVLTASADPNKFTGNSNLTSSFSRAAEQSLKVNEVAKQLSESYLGREERAEDKEEPDTLAQWEEPLEEKKPSLGAFDDTVREEKIFEQEQVIEHPVEEKATSLLKPGERKVLQNGADGCKTVTYEQHLVDGEAKKTEVVSEQIHREPVKEVALVGASGQQAAISPLDFGVELDENGIPVQYSRVLTNQVATGYHAGEGAWGASGQSLSAGYVAVHPGEIPYGTRMYITSPDNSFVYGFAIAADTGISLLGDVIDVDLYYDTYLESCLNGRRNVNIYILD